MSRSCDQYKQRNSISTLIDIFILHFYFLLQWFGQFQFDAVRFAVAWNLSKWSHGNVNLKRTKTTSLILINNFFVLCIILPIVKVVATIHQPSSRLLNMFDHLYIVADGSCMYQGPVSSLVPFLQSQNLLCPSYHNPADFGIYSTLIPFAHRNSSYRFWLRTLLTSWFWTFG